MALTIYELKEELGRRQSAALISISEAAAASAEIELDLSAREAELLTRQQMGHAWRNARNDAVKAAIEVSKDEYFAAEEEYAQKQRERVEEIHAELFGAARDLPASEMLTLVQASENALDQMLTMSLESGNDAVARAVLHTAYTREIPELLSRWREEVDTGDEDLGMLEELSEVWTEEQLEERQDPARFDRLADPMLPSVEDLSPSPSQPLLLKGAPRRGSSDYTI